MARGIKAAVGVKGRNLDGDVKTVQVLLNAALRKNGRFKASGVQPLTEDDRCGPKTKEAIRKYQEAVLGWSGNSVDGTVHPGRNTWRSLNGNTGTTRGEPAPKKAPAPTEMDGYLLFRQGDYRDRLGNGSLRISGHGCLLCTLTMAATGIGTPTGHWPRDLEPRELTPPIANRILRKGGGFSGSNIILDRAAATLGMTSVQFGWVSQKMAPLKPGDVTWIESHLAAGFPVAGYVDYKGTGVGDHWILLTRRRGDGVVEGVDPATGRRVGLTSSPRSLPTDPARNPRLTAFDSAVLFGWGQGGTNSQMAYAVVRFALLAPMGGGFSAAI